MILLFLPESFSKYFKYINLLVCLFQISITAFIYNNFANNTDAKTPSFQTATFSYEEKMDWIDLDLGALGQLSIDYFLAIDGLSVTLILLTAIVMTIAALSSWGIKSKVKGYFSLLLLLNTAIVGCFAALDLFLFFLFFEFMLLPMYFLIGLWGGPKREYAAIKFFIYTLFGSVFILIVMIGLYISVIDPVETMQALNLPFESSSVSQPGIKQVQEMLQNGEISGEKLVHTFSIPAMMDPGNYIPGSVLHKAADYFLWGMHARLVAFLLLMIGFAIKLPVVPFHTWLPDAHVEAPTPVSVILAGILLKIGAYGMIRIAYGIFPEGGIYFAWWIGFFGVVSILYAAMNALAMADIKKLIAYSSVSHMGFVLLGLASGTAEGVGGALFQLFSHGIITAILFTIAGVLYDRTQDRTIENYRGLAFKMPHFTAVVVVGFFASLGLPGFSGFIAEVLVLLGAFNSSTTNHLIPEWMAILATLGLLLSAAYYLWALQRMFFGEFWVFKSEWKQQLKDLTLREYVMFVPLIFLTLLLGVLPHFFLDVVGPSVGAFVEWVNTSGVFNLQRLGLI